MKKIIRLTLGVLVLLLSSCSDEPMKQSLCNEQRSPLLAELAAFNLSTIGSSSPKSRLSWLGWISVAAADGVGAYKGGQMGGSVGSVFGPHGAVIGAGIGGVIVGVGASYHSYALLNHWEQASQENHPRSKELSDIIDAYCQGKQNTFIDIWNIPLSFSSDCDSIAIPVGFKHNIVLENVISADTIFIGREALSFQEQRILEDQEFISCYNQLIKEAVIFENLPTTSVSDGVMKLFVNAFQQTSLSQSDIVGLVEEYVQRINASDELSQEDKLCLYIGLSVAAYSYTFWDNIYAEVEI